MMNAESVLRWPIFDGSAPDVESFVLDCDNIPGSTSTRAGPPSGRGVCEEDFHQLSQKFLAYVHVKNPILDIDEYKTYVRRAAEYGPGWDGPSCIVVSGRTFKPLTVSANLSNNADRRLFSVDNMRSRKPCNFFRAG
jgi:hypothetical protein